MTNDPIELILDPITSAVIRAYASARHQTREEAVAALLYRAAANMTGWPGPQGVTFEQAMLSQAQPFADGEELDLP